MNLAHQFAHEQHMTVEQAKERWDDQCIDFAGEMVERWGGRLGWFENPQFTIWRFHAAMVLNGVVHDLWMDLPLMVEDYCARVGCEGVEYPAEDATQFAAPS